MKFENVLKSVVIAGLLAGVTDVNAATTKGKLGADIHCPDITVTNNSYKGGGNEDWEAQVEYYTCEGNVLHKTEPENTVGVGKSHTFSVYPGSDLRIERKYQNTTRAITEGQNVYKDNQADLKINCTGTSESASCAVATK